LANTNDLFRGELQHRITQQWRGVALERLDLPAGGLDLLAAVVDFAERVRTALLTCLEPLPRGSLGSQWP